MPRTGSADLPLHYGKAPPWLFQRMVKLARAMTIAIVEDYGPEEVLRRMADPVWFQAFGCLLGFDWHSSGLTTTVSGALKEGLKDIESELGLYVAGGKGAASRKTPGEIQQVSESLGRDLSFLAYASRMAAKVDSAALQDGYQLYHHSFLFTARGQWAVVQQGMNTETRYARRYHWLGEKLKDFVCEPHSAIAAQRREPEVLNLVAAEGDANRQAIAFIAREEHPEKVVRDVEKLKHLSFPERHHIVTAEDISLQHLNKVLLSTYEQRPESFEALLALKGVGARTLRALSLAAELVYGAPASLRDPAAYSFAHGGKDGHPYPVNRRTYDETIAFLETALRRAGLGQQDKVEALRRLRQL
ncbi:MAG: DUF763 domain-containing protein [Chloroflexi bacterium]|nr:DUF763 domain-containing protein [Chloroflexota bacterium]